MVIFYSWAAGVDRLVEFMPKSEEEIIRPIVVCGIGSETNPTNKNQIINAVVWLIDRLRQQNIRGITHTGIDVADGTLSKQMKIASRLNARYTLLVGVDEIANNKLTIKDMDSGIQKCVTLEELIDLLHISNTT